MTWPQLVAFLIKHRRAIAIAVVIGLLAVTSWRLRHAKADLAAARGEVVQLRKAATDPKTGQAWSAVATTCRANAGELEAAIARGKAATAAAQAEGERRARALTSDLQQARRAAHGANQRAEALLAFRPTGADVCARVQAVDAEVLRGMIR